MKHVFLLMMIILVVSCYKEVSCDQVTAICTVNNGETQKCAVMNACEAQFFQDSIRATGSECNCTFIEQR